MYNEGLFPKENAIIEAGNFYKEAIKCDPEFLPSYGNLSLVFERAQKYEDALIREKKILREKATRNWSL